MSNDQASVETPLTIRIVGWALVIGGALYVLFGTIGVFSEVRSEALQSTVVVVFGVACFFIGRKLLQDRRGAYIAAVVLLALAVLAGAGRAIMEGDRAMLAQIFLPGVGLWLLLMQETRTHFARPPE
jgi:lysylphosphatidylglycerol synthetase-like protein (DUF2156 family)